MVPAFGVTAMHRVPHRWAYPRFQLVAIHHVFIEDPFREGLGLSQLRIDEIVKGKQKATPNIATGLASVNLDNIGGRAAGDRHQQRSFSGRPLKAQCQRVGFRDNIRVLLSKCAVYREFCLAADTKGRIRAGRKVRCPNRHLTRRRRQRTDKNHKERCCMSSEYHAHTVCAPLTPFAMSLNASHLSHYVKLQRCRGFDITTESALPDAISRAPSPPFGLHRRFLVVPSGAR